MELQFTNQKGEKNIQTEKGKAYINSSKTLT